MLNRISTENLSFDKDNLTSKAGANDHKTKHFGPGNYRLTKTDISYIVNGACFLASGGGGSIGLALLFMDKMIQDSDVMHYVNPNDIKANKNLSLVAILGSPDKMFEDLGQTAPLNAFLQMNKDLAKSGQEPLSYLMPVEMGAINTLIPFIISARKEIMVINGDPCGRAVPEMSMNLFNINKLSPNPIILTSDTDKSGFFQKIRVLAEDADDAENHARRFAKSHGSIAGIACYPMQGADLDCSVLSGDNHAKFIQWTVGLAWNLGQKIIESKNYNEFLAFLDSFSLSSHILFEGKITSKEERGIGGFDAGKVTVTNGDETFFIYYKNESLLAWNVTKKSYAAMGPDSISFLAKNDVQPFSNADINSNPEKNPKNIPLGTEIGIIGLSAFEELQDLLIVDLFLANIKETLTAFPEDNVAAPERYIPLSDLMVPRHNDHKMS